MLIDNQSDLSNEPVDSPPEAHDKYLISNEEDQAGLDLDDGKIYQDEEQAISPFTIREP